MLLEGDSERRKFLIILINLLQGPLPWQLQVSLLLLGNLLNFDPLANNIPLENKYFPFVQEIGLYFFPTKYCLNNDFVLINDVKNIFKEMTLTATLGNMKGNNKLPKRYKTLLVFSSLSLLSEKETPI